MKSAQIPLDIPLCVDGKMLVSGGTGVATYARMVRDASQSLSRLPLVLDARPAPLLPAWLAAMPGGTRDLRRVGSDVGRQRLEGDDLYRRAHIHFGYHKRLFRLRSRAHPFGIMHWTYPVPIQMTGWVNLYTVHDMIPIEQPDLTPINAVRHRAVLDAITAQATGIITVSHNARRAIIAGLGCAPDFVTNAGQSVDLPAPTDAQAAPALPGDLLPGGYLLILGSVEPRKNIAGMIAAYAASNTAMPLVVAGPDGWRSDDLNAIVAQTPGVVRLPYLERATAMQLVANARALLFASLAEGFGLPMIEAMAMGVPVMTSDRGALAEVADGAALLVDPTDQGEVAQAISRLSSDDGLCGDLKVRGITRAGDFSPARFADRLGAIYAASVQAYHTSSAARSGQDSRA